MKKRMLSLCLALVMVLSLLPVTAQANWTELDFNTYEELIALLAEAAPPTEKDQIDYGLYYRGSEPLVIEQDLVLPENVALYGYWSSIIVPEGVTLTAYGHIDTDELIINGTMFNHRDILIRDHLAVNGSLMAYSTVRIHCGCVAEGIQNITCFGYGVLMYEYDFEEDVEGFRAALETAAADQNPNVEYDIFFHGISSVFDTDLYIPENTYVQFNDGDIPNPDGKSLVIAEGCTLTNYGRIGLYTSMTIEGTLEHYGNDIIIGNEISGTTLTIASGGCLEVYTTLSISTDGDTPLEEVVPGLDLSQFHIDDYDSWYHLRPVNGGEYVEEQVHELEFTTFEELEELLCGITNPSDVVIATYTGTEPLVIKRDLTPSCRFLLFAYTSDVIIPAGVTMTINEHLQAGTLTVDGTLINEDAIAVGEKFTVNGTVTNLGSIQLYHEDALSVSGTMTHGPEGYVFFTIDARQDLTRLLSLLALAKDETDECIEYSISFDAAPDTDLFIPKNTDLWLFVEAPTISAGHTVTIEGMLGIQNADLIMEGNMINNGTLWVGFVQLDYPSSASVQFTDTGSYTGSGSITVILDTFVETDYVPELWDFLPDLDLSAFHIEHYGEDPWGEWTLTPKGEVHIHRWDSGTVTTPATCTTDGEKTCTCACGATKTEVIPAAHSYENGICVNCGEAEIQIAIGDATGDGTIDNVDAMLILQVAVGLLDPGAVAYEFCDVNNDGVVDNVDAMLVLQFAVGLIPQFPNANP